MKPQKIKGKATLIDPNGKKTNLGECTLEWEIDPRVEMDEFDRLTKRGYKLNLITGEYKKVRSKKARGPLFGSVFMLNR